VIRSLGRTGPRDARIFPQSAVRNHLSQGEGWFGMWNDNFYVFNVAQSGQCATKSSTRLITIMLAGSTAAPPIEPGKEDD